MAGRPSDYRPELCEEAIELGKRGKSKAQIASAFGTSRPTLDKWADDNPEFLYAIKEAQAHALAWWEEAGQSGLFADKFNATAFIFQMKNRFREDYRDKTEQEHSGQVTVGWLDG